MNRRSEGCAKLFRLAGLRTVLGAAAALLLASPAHAVSTQLEDGTTVSLKLTNSYSLAVRTGNANNALINGPVDAFVSTFMPSTQPGQPAQLVQFTHTGLPTTINFDDGDRNFKKWQPIYNRFSVLGELQIQHNNYGMILSGSGFYDQAFQRPNANTSVPFGENGATVNKTGTPNRFTAATRHFDGQRGQLLEAYVYGDWTFGSQSALDLRLGQQLVAWGESLFLSGISSAQGPADATKAFVPGAEVKDILLPTNQIAAQFQVTNSLTLLGQYKLGYYSTYIFPEGDYFSPADAVGPGATFVYGSANPLYLSGNSCIGLLSSALNSNAPQLTSVLSGLGVSSGTIDGLCGLGGGNGTALGASPTINTVRGPDINPNKHGQYGLGLKYAVTPAQTLGLYFLRYHDTNPAVTLHPGFASFAPNNPTLAPLLTTALINQYVPVSYQLKYYDGIKYGAVTYSTALGPFNIAGELGYRKGLDMPVTAVISGVVSPVYTRGNLSQAQISTIYVSNPGLFFDDLAFVAEGAVYHVNGVTPFPNNVPGINVVGNGDQLFYSRTSYGFQTLALPTKHNIISGWDLTTPVSYGMIIKGNPSLAGAFGPLYGEGDKRLSVGANMVYLSNLEIGIGYNFFFGNVNKTIGTSLLKANPYTDRDYASIHIKYDL